MSLDFVTALELIREGDEPEIDLTGHNLNEVNVFALSNAVAASTGLRALILAGSLLIYVT
jgi:hypothetical protein